jgi:putative redox protein
MAVVARGASGLRVDIEADGHRLVADEPPPEGEGNGPGPYDLLLGALGACTVMTMRLYADRKGWPLKGAQVRLGTYKIYARDCADCDGDPTARVDVIEREITLEGDLTAEQVARLGQIADRCPVHRTLSGEIRIRTEVLTL